MIYEEVIFDVETKKLFNEISDNDPANLGVSLVSLYQRKLNEKFEEIEGKIESFWEEEFEKMWPIFKNAKRIIGFNSLKFDVLALKPYAPSYFSKLPHFDILEKIKEATDRRTSLNSLAKSTLGKQKSDSGLNAVTYFAKGDPESLEKLKKYCEDDVLITRDIYDFALKNKKLKFIDHWNTPREIDLDFSYSEKEILSPSQTSLF
jgi:DEAD/DEAH box helicase domain-containing protein